MHATTTLTTVQQARDLQEVARLWRRLGYTPRTVAVYCSSMRGLLQEARVRDYQHLCAERVVRQARAHARRLGRDPRAVQKHWLPAFRAFAWGLQQLGGATGSIQLPRKTSTRTDPTIVAFVKYGQMLGWSDATLKDPRLLPGTAAPIFDPTPLALACATADGLG